MNFFLTFKQSPLQPEAGRTMTWHPHGSNMPTTPRAIYVLKAANANDIMPSVYAAHLKYIICFSSPIKLVVRCLSKL